MVVGSCASTNANSLHNILPRDSFLHIKKTVTVAVCSASGCKEKTYKAIASGSAVKTNQAGTFVLTAAHVCDTTRRNDKELKVTDSFQVTTLKGNKYSATKLTYDNDIDACLLFVKELKLKPIKFADSAPKAGDKAYNIGAPLGIFAPGVVPILEGRYIGSDSVETALYSIPAAPGSSGSPILNTNGELIGMIHSVYRRFAIISISVEYHALKKFLEKGYEKYKFYAMCDCKHFTKNKYKLSGWIGKLHSLQWNHKILCAIICVSEHK